MALRSKCSFNEQQGKVKQARVRGNNRCHVGKAESATGAMQGRGRRQTERISKGRQGQKAGSKRSECIGSPGKHRETEYRGNAQNVSRGTTRLRGECKEVCCLYVCACE